MNAATQFKTPNVDATWADSHETHKAVAMAIHAIASEARTPEQIWEDPTQGEFDTVAMAVENYVTCGVFQAEDDGRYQWGDETITIAA